MVNPEDLRPTDSSIPESLPPLPKSLEEIEARRLFEKAEAIKLFIIESARAGNYLFEDLNATYYDFGLQINEGGWKDLDPVQAHQEILDGHISYVATSPTPRPFSPPLPRLRVNGFPIVTVSLLCFEDNPVHRSMKGPHFQLSLQASVSDEKRNKNGSIMYNYDFSQGGSWAKSLEFHDLTGKDRDIPGMTSGDIETVGSAIQSLQSFVEAVVRLSPSEPTTL